MSTVMTNAAELVAEARREFAARNPESARLHAEACKVLPGGHTRAVLSHEPFALTFVRGQGAVLTDADGHEYIDLLGDYTRGSYMQPSHLRYPRREGRMAVLIRHRAAGITLEQYDEISPALVELVKQQPGFVVHVAYEDAQGACVAEIWETKEQHDSFFNEHVVPNVPAEIKQEVIELHSLHTP